MFDDLDHLPGLLPGVYRGLEISIVDMTSDVGRRVIEYLFPGVDAAAYDDFGLAPEMISLEALIIGDDYKLRSKALQAAFERPGPGLLIHPWMGPMQTILEESAQIRVSVRELRVARISVRLKRVRSAGLLSAFSGLGDLVSGLSSAASLLSLAVGVVVMSRVQTAAAARTGRVVVAALASLQPPVSSGRFVTDMAGVMASASSASPADLDAAVVSIASLFATVDRPAAVAPAAEAQSLPTASPRARMTIGLDLAGRLVDALAEAPATADCCLILAAAAHITAQSAVQSAYASFTSRQDALGWRNGVLDLLDRLIEEAEALDHAYQSEASAFIRAARALASGIVADVHEIIGRLPAVLSIATAEAVDAYAVAQHLAGDNPQLIESVYRDIIARNDPVHPAELDAGAVEVLDTRR